MLLKHSRCGLSVFLFPMIILILYLGFHKIRAALGKVIIKILVEKHGYSSFVNLIPHIILPNLNFVNRFNKNYNAKMAVCFLEATPCKDTLTRC